MKKEFKQLILINLLIVIELIPAVILITVLIQIYDNLYFWLIVGIITFIIINYILYRTQENDRIRQKDN